MTVVHKYKHITLIEWVWVDTTNKNMDYKLVLFALFCFA